MYNILLQLFALAALTAILWKFFKNLKSRNEDVIGDARPTENASTAENVHPENSLIVDGENSSAEIVLVPENSAEKNALEEGDSHAKNVSTEGDSSVETVLVDEKEAEKKVLERKDSSTEFDPLNKKSTTEDVLEEEHPSMDTIPIDEKSTAVNVLEEGNLPEDMGPVNENILEGGDSSMDLILIKENSSAKNVPEEGDTSMDMVLVDEKSTAVNVLEEGNLPEDMGPVNENILEGGDSSMELVLVDEKSTAEDDSKVEKSLTKNFATTSDVPKQEYNILLLGETGAGKSTTVNAFANYLKFSNFADAFDTDEFTQLIPSKFILPTPGTGAPFVIDSGKDSNELHNEDGVSCTQSPEGYKFELGNRVFRIIDTPGMGDTRGTDIDKKNFEQILNYLHHHKSLHGVCILVKSTETRKTASFRYCINELLTYLHKSASKNIVFCFTFSRNSFYGPGEGFATLKSCFENELKEANLSVKYDENCFFIDNEAFRFLVAKKKGYPFQPNQELSYQESWDKSVAQVERMFTRIIELEPHNLQETQSLNHARKIILELAEPIVRMQDNCNHNIAQLNKKMAELNESEMEKKELVKHLEIEVDDLESRPLDKPTTVCTAMKCVEVIKFREEQKINYKTLCHIGCGLRGVDTGRIGHPNLQSCDAMNYTMYCAANCGCPWEVHMHIRVEYRKVKCKIEDKKKAQEIKTKEDAIKRIEDYVENLRSKVDQYQEEIVVMQEVSSKFAVFLSSNSNTPYNKFLEPYLQLLIDEEEKKIHAVEHYSRDVYDSLIQMRETHKENVRILKRAIKNKQPQAIVNIEDIEMYRSKLLDLKISGPQFRQIMQTVNESCEKVVQTWDKKTAQSSTVSKLSSRVSNYFRSWLPSSSS